MPEPLDSRLELATSWGPICVTARDGRIIACELPPHARRASEPPVVHRSRLHIGAAGDRAVLKRAEQFIRAALAGRPARVPPLALMDGAPFFSACRRAMRRIPPGRTVTYRELARRAGRPSASRAAGQACARNPLPLFVPCHRVLAANGRLGGFSAGLGWKQFLLQVEAAQ